MSYQSICNSLRKTALLKNKNLYQNALRSISKLTRLVKNPKFDLYAFSGGYQPRDFNLSSADIHKPEWLLGVHARDITERQDLSKIVDKYPIKNVLRNLFLNLETNSNSPLPLLPILSFLDKHYALKNSGLIGNALARLQRAGLKRSMDSRDKDILTKLLLGAKALRASLSRYDYGIDTVQDANKLADRLLKRYE